jgi:MinD superfamily P-loop ATPase
LPSGKIRFLIAVKRSEITISIRITKMPWIDVQRCDGCGDCVDTCILKAIRLTDGSAEILMDRCHRCGACHETCPVNAIYYGCRHSQDQGWGGVARLPVVLGGLFNGHP